MTHRDHVRLIEKGIVEKGGVWADFGSGGGAFTLALRDIAGPDVRIYSVDKNASSLQVQKQAFDEIFPDTDIQFITDDFTRLLDLPMLDGILAANSIHFVKDKIPLLKLFKSYLKPRGRLLVVEYNVDLGNIWVPYPFSYNTFEKLVSDAGFHDPTLLANTPSDFLHEMYAAAAFP